MIEVPNAFPLPADSFERQRSLLGTHVEEARHSPRHVQRRVLAVAAVVLVSGLLVAPGIGLGSRLFIFLVLFGHCLVKRLADLE